MDGIFRKQLRDYQQAAPESVWNSIEESLDQHTKVKRIAFYKVAAAIAAFALLASTFLYFANNEKELENSTRITEQAVSEKVNKEIPNADEVKDNSTKNAIQVNEADEQSTKEVIADADIPKVEAEAEWSKGFLVENDKTKEITSLAKLEEVNVILVNSQVQQEIIDTRKQKIKALLNTLPSIYDDSYALNIVNEEKAKPDASKWIMGGEFSPLYSYRNITSTSGAYSEDYYNSTEKPVMTYSGGLNLQYKAIDRLTIQAGVYYTTMGQSLDYMSVYANANYNIVDDQYKDRFVNTYAIENSTGDFVVKSEYVFVDNKAARVENLSSSKGEADLTDPVYSNVNAQLEQKYQYVEVPFLLRYKVIDRVLDVNILGGFGANFLVGNDVLMKYGGTTEVIGTVNGLNPVNYTGTIGFGIEYPVMKRINIHLEPSFRYYLNEMNSNSTVESHPYSIGIFTGINYSF